MTPGKSTEAELRQFGNQFSYNSTFFIHENTSYILYYRTSLSGDTTFAIRFFIGNGTIQSIDLGVDTARYYMTLSKLLNDYGKPTGILVGLPKHQNNLSMLVLYEDQQFMAEYVLFQNETDNSSYCYDPPFSPWTIISWASGKNWLDFINQRNEAQSYKPLDEVSDYDIPSLHEILKNSNQVLCMRIKVDKILP
jgi:hypothetical protein